MVSLERPVDVDHEDPERRALEDGPEAGFGAGQCDLGLEPFGLVAQAQVAHAAVQHAPDEQQDQDREERAGERADEPRSGREGEQRRAGRGGGRRGEGGEPCRQRPERRGRGTRPTSSQSTPPLKRPSIGAGHPGGTSPNPLPCGGLA